jgi:hypothetical protein
MGTVSIASRVLFLAVRKFAIEVPLSSLELLHFRTSEEHAPLKLLDISVPLYCHLVCQ